MKQTLTDVEAARLVGCPVVVRSDLNVPLEDGRIEDDQRIKASLPTIQFLVDGGARVVVLSHLGRPKGEVVAEMSLAAVAERLEELLEHPVALIPHDVEGGVEAAVAALPAGTVALLENTRFLPGETENERELAERWGRLGELFVNDAFGTAHRAHASTEGVARVITGNGGRAVAGLLMARELRFLEEVLRAPERPFISIIGGAKISSKIGVISALLPRVDRLLIGGAMANTFFRALGLQTGASLVEEDTIDLAARLIEQGGERLVLPVDCVVATEMASGVETRVVGREDVGGSEMILDIGPESTRRFAATIEGSRSIVWNGPMGVFEIEDFAAGTIAIAEAVARACAKGALGVVGGGDSSAAAQRAGVTSRLTHVSTGGGASLELLAGGPLPAVEALSNR